MMYMYPDNLAGKPTLWLWYLQDIGIIGVGAIISVVLLSQFYFYIPFVIVAAYAFLTIRFNDTSIFDFIKYGCVFFITGQQIFYWSMCHDECVENVRKTKRKRGVRFWEK